MASLLKLSWAAAALLLALPAIARADKLTITSTPSGATVELDGVVVGTTPFEKHFPGGYFHKTHTVFGSRLQHPMMTRLSLAGYVTKEIKLTDGPIDWISLNGHNRGEYWLFKSDHFHVDLQLIPEVFNGDIAADSGAAVDVQPGAALEDVVRRTKPAVVHLRGMDRSGSGFFVTGTGVIATNAHLARGEEVLRVQLSTGQELQAKVVYVDDNFDIAFAKAEDPSGSMKFPHLVLADFKSVQQGERVLAIGNPGDAMAFSATQGIVSAVGEFPNAGPGTWIQTDAPINPGNSGGPLVNARGQVIGINTQKLVAKGITGIGFALSVSDLRSVLSRFYAKSARRAREPSETEPSMEPLAAPPEVLGFGTVAFNEPVGAEIWIDHSFVGNIPSTLRLSSGSHLIVIRDHAHSDWIRHIAVQKDSHVTVKPDFR